MQKLLILVPLLVLFAGCGESTSPSTTPQADAPKTEVATPPAMMRVEYYEISKK